jgi:hypothetical protein
MNSLRDKPLDERLDQVCAEIKRLSEAAARLRRERDEAIYLRAENTHLRVGRRSAAQSLIEVIGAHGPESIEETAERAVKEIKRLRGIEARCVQLHGQLRSELKHADPDVFGTGYEQCQQNFERLHEAILQRDAPGESCRR